MYFLIDLENVHNAGMSGVRYLNENDTLILFFAEASKNLEHRHLENIAHSGCTLETYKLKSTGKNALDYYIAVRVGEILQVSPNDIIAIVSRDKGYKAVREYVQKRAEFNGRVICAESIEKAIIATNNSDERTKIAQSQSRMENIEPFAAKYAERQRIEKSLQQHFSGTEYESMLPDIISIVAGKKPSAKVIYLDSLKRFGRKNGVDIYRQLKNCAIF